MSQYTHHQAPVVYPPPPTPYPPTTQPGQYAQSYPPPVQGYNEGPYVAPPPVGYPMKNGPPAYPNQSALSSQSRGDGFWKGCCAAMCCCCLLDMCF